MTAGPVLRAERYRVGLRTLASLVAGRASYRLVLLATTVLLLPVWGEQRYGTYAAAMASFTWLTALVFTGPEKAMLKLLPRAPRTGPAVTAALVAVLWWLPLPVAAAFALVRLLDGPGAAAVHVGVAAMQLSVGATMLLVALHRAAGRPRADTTTFLVMSGTQVGLLAAAAAGYLQPVGYVAAVIATQVAVNLVLSAGLGRPSLRIRHRPRFLRRLGLTAVLLSGTDLFLFLSTAVLFLLLQATGHAGQVGRLYAVLLVLSVGANLLLYLLRVHAPRTSLRLAGRAGAAGRGRAARLGAVVAALNGAWLVAVVLAVGLTDVAGITSPAGQVVVWAVLVTTSTPALALLLWAGYLLENTDARAPGVVAIAAAAGLVTVVAVGAAAMPALGGVGLIIASVAGETGYALVLATLGRPRGYRSAATAAPGAGSSPPAVPGPSTGVRWRGQSPTATRSAPGGTRSSSTGRRDPGSENVTTPSRPRA